MLMSWLVLGTGNRALCFEIEEAFGCGYGNLPDDAILDARMIAERGETLTFELEYSVDVRHQTGEDGIFRNQSMIPPFIAAIPLDSEGRKLPMSFEPGRTAKGGRGVAYATATLETKTAISTGVMLHSTYLFVALWEVGHANTIRVCRLFPFDRLYRGLSAMEEVERPVWVIRACREIGNMGTDLPVVCEGEGGGEQGFVNNLPKILIRFRDLPRGAHTLTVNYRTSGTDRLLDRNIMPFENDSESWALWFETTVSVENHSRIMVDLELNGKEVGRVSYSRPAR